MGTHPKGMSSVDGGVPLTDVAGGDLSFMLKVLAVDQPLSLQVHPNADEARAGFKREEAAGVPIDAPHRSFPDPHAKREMVYALTEFDTLVGLRPTAEALRILDGLGTEYTSRLADELRTSMGFAGIVKIIEKVLAEGVPATDIAAVLKRCAKLADRGLDVRRAYATALEVGAAYPDDPGVIITLFLNRLTLQPGEAAYLDTGIIHAHLRGLCVEIMRSSDNVLRAGLTKKHVDPSGLVRCMEVGMSRLARVTPDRVGSQTEVFTPDPEVFALAVTQSSRGEAGAAELPPAGQRILLCTAGKLELESTEGQVMKLRRGESVYVGPGDGKLHVRGTGEIVQAYIDSEEHGHLIDLV